MMDQLTPTQAYKRYLDLKAEYNTLKIEYDSYVDDTKPEIWVNLSKLGRITQINARQWEIANEINEILLLIQLSASALKYELSFIGAATAKYFPEYEHEHATRESADNEAERVHQWLETNNHPRHQPIICQVRESFSKRPLNDGCNLLLTKERLK